MTFEPVFEMTKLESLRRLCSAQAVVEAKLMPQSGAEIARVLSIATDCSAAAGEVFASEARYSGRVSFKMIYIDTQGANRSMDYNVDFSDKIVNELIAVGMRPVVTAHVLDTDIVSVNEREIKLASVVEVHLDTVVTDNIGILTQGGEGIYTHDDKLEYSRLVCECADSYLVGDTASNVGCSNILLAEPRIVVSRIKCGENVVTAEGKIVCDICCEAEDGTVFSYQQTTSFIQEIQAQGATSECFALGGGSIASFKTTVETDNTTSAVIFDFNIDFWAKVFNEETCAPVVDAFSVTHELLQSGRSINVCRNKLNTLFSDRVDGSVTLDVNMPAADNILAITGAKINIASAVAKDGKIIFEGAAVCSIIYFSTDTDTKNSVAVELPFSFPVNAAVGEADEVTARGVVTKITAKIRRGNEIDIKADIELETSVSSYETKYVITELKQGEERALPTGAFSIHIAKAGETLWDVAKALGTTPELVLSQNPKLTLPLNGGERVMAYRILK